MYERTISHTRPSQTSQEGCRGSSELFSSDSFSLVEFRNRGERINPRNQIIFQQVFGCMQDLFPYSRSTLSACSTDAMGAADQGSIGQNAGFHRGWFTCRKVMLIELRCSLDIGWPCPDNTVCGQVLKARMMGSFETWDRHPPQHVHHRIREGTSRLTYIIHSQCRWKKVQHVFTCFSRHIRRLPIDIGSMIRDVESCLHYWKSWG